MTRQGGKAGVLWVALCASLLAASGVRAAELKLGYIDSDRIFQSYEKTKTVQDDFNREVADISKTAREKKTEIDDLQRQLIADAIGRELAIAVVRRDRLLTLAATPGESPATGRR